MTTMMLLMTMMLTMLMMMLLIRDDAKGGRVDVATIIRHARSNEGNRRREKALHAAVNIGCIRGQERG